MIVLDIETLDFFGDEAIATLPRPLQLAAMRVGLVTMWDTETDEWEQFWPEPGRLGLDRDVLSQFSMGAPACGDDGRPAAPAGRIAERIAGMLQRIWQALFDWPPGALRFLVAALLTYPHGTWVLCLSPHVVGIVIFDDRAKKAYLYRRRIIHAETGWQLWIRIV